MPFQVAILGIYALISHGYIQSIILQFTALYAVATLIIGYRSYRYKHPIESDDDEIIKTAKEEAHT